MNEPASKPVKSEATPVVAGSAEPVPKVHHRKRWIIIATVVAALIIIGGVIWWLLWQQANYLSLDGLKSGDVRIDSAKTRAEQPVPKDAKDKATYYATIAADLQAGKAYTYAEHYLLTAQKVADDNKLDKKEYRYYLGLTSIYKAMGNQKKADEYTKKENDFLNANYSADVLKQMRETPTDAPHKQ